MARYLRTVAARALCAVRDRTWLLRVLLCREEAQRLLADGAGDVRAQLSPEAPAAGVRLSVAHGDAQRTESDHRAKGDGDWRYWSAHVAADEADEVNSRAGAINKSTTLESIYIGPCMYCVQLCMSSVWSCMS